MYAGSGDKSRLGALGARLPIVIVALPLSLSPLPSTTPAAHVMTSFLDAVVLSKLRVELVPSVAPVVVLVQVKLSVKDCPSASDALIEQVRVSSLYAGSGEMLTAEMTGAVLAIDTEELRLSVAP